MLMSGTSKFNPGLVLVKSVDAGTVGEELAAEDPVLWTGYTNFDPRLVLARSVGIGTVWGGAHCRGPDDGGWQG